MNVVYPSPEFPPAPAVGLEIPDGWVGLRLPGAVMTVAKKPAVVSVFSYAINQDMGDEDMLMTTIARIYEGGVAQSKRLSVEGDSVFALTAEHEGSQINTLVFRVVGASVDSVVEVVGRLGRGDVPEETRAELRSILSSVRVESPIRNYS